MFPPSTTRSDYPQQGVITFGLAGGFIVYRRLADLRDTEWGRRANAAKCGLAKVSSITPTSDPRSTGRTCKVDPGSSLPGSGGVCGGEDTDGGTVTLAADYCGGYAPQLPCGSSRLGGTSGHACRVPSGYGVCTPLRPARSYRTHASREARSCLPL